jgi:isopenicillin N synthase-like dioxygenase
MSWVPVVDLAADDAPEAVAEAAARCGFLTIVGHGVAPHVSEAAWIQARAFFDLPAEEKMAVAMPRPGYPYGYSPLLGETLAASLGNGGPPDLKESFAIGPVDAPRHTMLDPDESFAWSANLWPSALPDFRSAWEAYFREMSALAARLLSTMAVALGLSARHFESSIDRHTSAMRALNYPAPSAVSAGQLGAGAHTDYGTLTILLADPVQQGLQVRDDVGEWRPVTAVPGSFVVNLGDAMARWTNDRWRSTLHRVVLPAARRQSIAFFHNANWDAMIECLPTCRSADEPAKYEPIAAGPHLMSKFRSTVNY